MLEIIDTSLSSLLENSAKKLNEAERLDIFIENVKEEFTRKDYMKYFNQLSSATASRDLKKGVENQIIEKSGDKKTTIYSRIKN